MNTTELTSPIRVYWDIDPGSRDVIPRYPRICDELAGNKILALNLTEAAPAVSPGCISILEKLSGKQMAIALTLSPAALNAETIELLRKNGVKTVLVRSASLADLDQIAGLRKQPDAPRSLGISFEVDRNNYADLPEVLAFCVRNEISPLVLPMQRLLNGHDCFYLTAEKGRELAGRIARIEKPSWLKITIHDPFLWRTFFPMVEFPNGGCHAANTMLYISPQADVYPCPSLPVKLGNLLQGTLKEIIRSERKKELRKRLASPPRECGGCEALASCKGGCRGRAYRLTNSLNSPDPACK